MDRTCHRNRKNGVLALTVFLFIITLCGCIGENEPMATTAPPATMPTTMYTFPMYAYQLQERIEETSAAFEMASAEWQSALEALQALVQSSNPDQDELYQAFIEYDAAIRAYEHMLQKYYRMQILSEHTEPTEGGFLGLKKETVPFDRPDGKIYPFGVLNMGAEGYMVHEGEMRRLIAGGIEGPETSQALLWAIESMEKYLLEYHDIMVGYVYYEMSRYLHCLSLYSDGLADIEGCNPFLLM